MTSGRSAVSARTAVQVRRERRLGGPQVEPGQRVERLAQGAALAAISAESSSRMRAISSASATCASRQALPSSTATSGSMNSVWPLPDASWTMPLTRAARLGLDRDHVAAVAQRDDGLLERAAELRPDQRVQAATQPVVGDPDRRPQPAQPRRRGVQQLADRVEAAGERGADRGQRVQLAPDVAEQRATLVGERRREARGRVERLGDLEELAGLQPAAAGRALHRRADVVRRADADAGSLGRAAPGPGRSRRAGARRRRGSLDGSSASARRRDGGNEVAAASRSRTSGNSSRALRAGDPWGRRRRASARPPHGPLTEGWPAHE